MKRERGPLCEQCSAFNSGSFIKVHCSFSSRSFKFVYEVGASRTAVHERQPFMNGSFKFVYKNRRQCRPDPTLNRSHSYLETG